MALLRVKGDVHGGTKLITVAVVSERLKVNGSVARVAIQHLEEKGLIAPVGEKHHACSIYTRKIGGDGD